MDFEKIKQILEVLKSTRISELTYEKAGRKVYIKRKPVTLLPNVCKEVNPQSQLLPEAEQFTHTVIKSGYVGTVHLLYPDTQKEIVKTGDFVKKGDVLCIIEAMKLFKEIFSEMDGRIVRVSVKDGMPVQYGQELFWIE